MGINSKTLTPGGTPAAEPDGEHPPRDEIFDVLSNERRQCILHYLKQQDGRRVDLRELVDYVAAWENDTTTEAVDGDQRKRVYAALRQSHLPKLHEAGIVEYENLRGGVELTDEARRVQKYLEYVPEGELPWSVYYLAISAVGAAIVAVTWAGVSPFAAIPALAIATVVVGLFALSAVVHTYQTRRNPVGYEEFEVN